MPVNDRCHLFNYLLSLLYGRAFLDGLTKWKFLLVYRLDCYLLHITTSAFSICHFINCFILYQLSSTKYEMASEVGFFSSIRLILKFQFLAAKRHRRAWTAPPKGVTRECANGAWWDFEWLATQIRCNSGL